MRTRSEKRAMGSMNILKKGFLQAGPLVDEISCVIGVFQIAFLSQVPQLPVTSILLKGARSAFLTKKVVLREGCQVRVHQHLQENEQLGL